jgi:hypothetical protein
VDETPEVFYGNLYHLDQLVLVGVGGGGLLDAAGEKEVGPVVLEAGGGGQGAQEVPLAAGGRYWRTRTTSPFAVIGTIIAASGRSRTK